MSGPSMPPAPQRAAEVLRAVPLAAQPVMLRRPGRAPAVGAAAPQDGELAALLRAAREEGFAEGARDGARQAEGRLRESHERLATELREEQQRQQQQAGELARRQEDWQARQSQADGELRARAQALDGLAQAFAEQSAALLARGEDELLALCHAVACALLGETLADPERLRAHVTAQLHARQAADACTVMLHPQDLALLRRLGTAAPGQGIDWRAGDGIALGGCIVRDAAGGLDARWELQLERLRDTLREVRARRLQDAGA